MKFRRLEVRSYRAIDEALLDFGPGLNVLYGPNDLGKTTLASAMRAALLLPADSTAHQAFVAWHGAEPPRVSLSFESDAVVYRVTKTFGLGSLGSARLESSPDGLSFHEDERGRAVDRRLRELLRWGIEAPGGKGGGKGLPESFLSHVLLAAQAGVPMILERTLIGDRDTSGRERLHDALAALAQDPLFKRVLEAAQAKVDAAFTPTGRRKTGQNSPFAPLKEQITQLAQEFERLSHQRRESEDVQQRIEQLSDERLAQEAEVAALEQRVTAQAALLERRAAHQRAIDCHSAAKHVVLGHAGLQAELTRLRAELGATRERAELNAQKLAAAAALLSEAEARAAAGDRALADLSSELPLERQALERAALQAEHQERREALLAAEELTLLESAALAAEAAWQAEHRELEVAEAAEGALRQKLQEVEAALAEARQLELACQWREANACADRARAARGDALELEAKASALRARATADDAAGRRLAETSPATLNELRSLDGQIRVAAGRLEVGLAVALTLPVGCDVALSIDGVAEPRRVGTGQRIWSRGRSRVQARVSGGIELEAVAGDPELREKLALLERRWAEEAVPLLQAAGADTLDALAERLEAERARLRDAAAALRESVSLEARAAEKRERGLELEVWEQRAEQRRQALGRLELSELRGPLDELGAAWEVELQKRIGAANAERARASAALEARAAALVRVTTRLGALAESRDAASTRRDAALARHGLSDVERPSLLQLKQRVTSAEQAKAAAAGKLEAWERRLALQSADARRAREQAALALSEARRAHDAAQAASLAAREGELTLAARVREREHHLGGVDMLAGRLELERAEAELRGFGELDELTLEDLARSEGELERARAELQRSVGELRRAEGALGHVGGDVVVERERQTREALERARALELDQEREYEAFRLLAETLRGVENEAGAHLGRALEAPVSERFERLTEGRYRNVGLDSGLGLQGVFVAGQARAYRDLSEGTQEQLATILRLCIAEHLQTAIVLDDHLAQTHRRRAEWFRQTLREAALRIQIIVLTARPEDYLSPAELGDGTAPREASGALVRAIDLEGVIKRAVYTAAASREAAEG